MLDGSNEQGDATCDCGCGCGQCTGEQQDPGAEEETSGLDAAAAKAASEFVKGLEAARAKEQAEESAAKELASKHSIKELMESLRLHPECQGGIIGISTKGHTQEAIFGSAPENFGIAFGIYTRLKDILKRQAARNNDRGPAAAVGGVGGMLAQLLGSK